MPWGPRSVLCQPQPPRRPRRSRSRPVTAPAVISSVAELLEVERLRVRFRALKPLAAKLAGVRDPMIDAVADVSLGISEGGAFGLVGESGSGKTTLGRAIMGLVSVWSGEIRLAGEVLFEISRR